MNLRIVKCEFGDKVWWQVEKRFLGLFWWHSVYYTYSGGPLKYDTFESALTDAKTIRNRVTKELVMFI
jgi:hypothetical protein